MIIFLALGISLCCSSFTYSSEQSKKRELFRLARQALALTEALSSTPGHTKEKMSPRTKEQKRSQLQANQTQTQALFAELEPTGVLATVQRRSLKQILEAIPLAYFKDDCNPNPIDNRTNLAMAVVSVDDEQAL